MVDYDAAVKAVQDQNADPILLAKVAYENPEFGANVAVNPRAYPGLLRWLAEFGDDRARETVAQVMQQRNIQPGYDTAAQPVAGTNQPAAQPVAQDDLWAAQPAAQPDPYAAQPAAQPDPYAAQPAAQPDPYAAQPAAQPDPYAAQPAAAQPAAQPDPYAASPYAQAPQNPYGFTAELARTTTDQMQMAEIAQKAPELYAALAQNPNLYPALVDWLAQLGDPAVNAALANRK